MPRRPGDKLPSNADELDGVTKAAVLMLSIDPLISSKILQHLPTEAVEDLTREVAGIGRVPPGLKDEIIDEFYGLSLVHSGEAEGGLDSAAVLLRQSLDPKIAEHL
ncbi:MAG: hypothetical protein AAGB34_06285 [Planctomycetota bacterium]